jgi:hypothetical protein
MSIGDPFVSSNMARVPMLAKALSKESIFQGVLVQTKRGSNTRHLYNSTSGTSSAALKMGTTQNTSERLGTAWEKSYGAMSIAFLLGLAGRSIFRRILPCRYS